LTYEDGSKGIIDYKTSRVLDERRCRYQLAFYSLLVENVKECIIIHLPENQNFSVKVYSIEDLSMEQSLIKKYLKTGKSERQLLLEKFSVPDQMRISGLIELKRKEKVLKQDEDAIKEILLSRFAKKKIERMENIVATFSVVKRSERLGYYIELIEKSYSADFLVKYTSKIEVTKVEVVVALTRIKCMLKVCLSF
jgi:hypothetical protein